jgi:DNA topoisomerase-1
VTTSGGNKKRATAKPKSTTRATKKAKSTTRSTTKARTARASSSTRTRSSGAGGSSPNAPNVVVVESPAKARTLGRILGSEYNVMASLGHVRDLPDGKLGVEVDNDFTPIYETREDKQKILKELRDASKKADAVYLATDPDREGEAISWHLMESAGIRPEQARRVVFHEITADAIRRAFEEPRDIDVNLVDAQQARRILDRLVGYQLSPFLWKKVRRGLSAGRVQSVAVRIVVDREREREAFQTREYWSIGTELGVRGADTAAFPAELQNVRGQRGKIEIPDQATAERLVADLSPAAFQVSEVRKRETLRRPAAPFRTSTMQQEASRKLRFTARRTMTVAQQLYEGLPVPGGDPVGLITYMRTDSTTMAQEAIQEARTVIEARYGKDSVPARPRSFQANVRGAQEAHEAIRPTSFARDPESLRDTLQRDQWNLYQLVWQRAIASQMADAKFDQTSVDIAARATPSGQEYVLRATGSIMTFAGFLAIYREGLDEPEEDSDEGRLLPDLREGQDIDLRKIDPNQHFTQPPPRYTEATLIKAMEEKGIGRPSTYAPILATIQDRGYVDKDDNRIRPLKLGTAVTDLLMGFFPQIVDLDFTSAMEGELDEVARGERQWVPLLRDFYGPFDERLQIAKVEAPRVRDIDEDSDEICPECGKPMVIKRGRFGPFLSCSNFPECKGTMRIQVKADAQCPECGGDLVSRKSSKSGRGFFGCSNYPTCSFLVNDKPLAQPCPQCGGLTVAQGHENAKCHDAKECGWQGSQEELKHEHEGEAIAAGV